MRAIEKLQSDHGDDDLSFSFSHVQLRNAAWLIIQK